MMSFDSIPGEIIWVVCFVFLFVFLTTILLIFKIRKQTEKEIKNKAKQLKTLYETGKKITSIISKEELLPWIAEQASKLLHADGCHYRLREGDDLVRAGGTKEGMELMVKERIKIGESLSGIIAKEKKPLFVRNILEDSRFIEEHKQMAKRIGYTSYLGVPMCIEERIIGVLNIATKKPRKFTEKDIEFLSSFADLSAIAIENSRLFEDLKEAKEDLAKFSGKILSIREEEKRKLSSDLHDEVGSLAGGLNLNLSIIENKIKDNNQKEAMESIRRSRDLLEEASRNLKNIAKELRPPDFDIIGLPAALREYFSNLKKHSEISIDFNVDIDEEALNDEVSIILYRVAQEALNNIIKHAEARKVRIRLSFENHHIKFDISDDGKGFDMKKTLRHRGEFLKMGIIGMRERTESLGGRFLIESKPGRGTKIKITLPYRGENHEYKNHCR